MNFRSNESFNSSNLVPELRRDFNFVWYSGFLEDSERYFMDIGLTWLMLFAFQNVKFLFEIEILGLTYIR